MHPSTVGKIGQAVWQYKPLPPKDKTCKDCYFFEISDESDLDGFCNRYPPVGRDWSQVNRGYWCGEFREE